MKQAIVSQNNTVKTGKKNLYFFSSGSESQSYDFVCGIFIFFSWLAAESYPIFHAMKLSMREKCIFRKDASHVSSS